MTRKKTKNEIIKRNERVINDLIPKYLNELRENNSLLQQELKKWESIDDNISNPHNMKQHLERLNKELNEWRNLIPGKSNIQAAKKYINKYNIQSKANIDDVDVSDMDFYNSVFIPSCEHNYHIQEFANVDDFVRAKHAAIQVILNEDFDPLTKTVNDPHYFIKYFEFKKEQLISDKDFDVDTIDEYTKYR